MSKAWPPCMRIIVKETKVKNLQIGSLFIITCEGGTLGREGDHALLIPDINISKVRSRFTKFTAPTKYAFYRGLDSLWLQYHARFNFDTKDEKNEIGNYTLTDLGSRNGTFVDGKRLSNALQESEPLEILHDSTIRVGGTTLLCHIHVGRETCADCEPGLLLPKGKQKSFFLWR